MGPTLVNAILDVVRGGDARLWNFLGSVSARASRYTFVLRGKVWASPGLQDADRREGPGEDVQSAVIGGNMLVAV